MKYYFAGFTLSPLESFVLTVLIILFCMVVLSPAVLCFGRAWSNRKRSAQNTKWHERPTILVIIGVAYLISIPLFLGGADVLDARGVISRYKGPIYQVTIRGHEIQTMYTPGDRIIFYYNSPHGRYSLEQTSQKRTNEGTFDEQCNETESCFNIGKTSLGKVDHDKYVSPYSVVETKNSVIEIRQLGDNKDITPEVHKQIAQSLKPISSSGLLKIVILKIRDY
jgi:hypothetical protein